MQITLDLPDDVFAKADTLAREQSRSLNSVLTELIQSLKPATRSAAAPPSGPLAMLGYARRFQAGTAPTTDEIMRELREGDHD